jgi:hypothetical protein
MPIEPTNEQIASETARVAAIAKEQAPLLAKAATVPLSQPAIETPIAVIGAMKEPPLGPTETRAMRDAWIAAGLDVAAFDRAAEADGLDGRPAVSPEVAAQHADYGLPVTPSPDDYRPLFSNARSLTSERLTALSNETRTWAAAMQFSPEIGTAVIEHLAAIGPAFSKMAPQVKQDWLREQQAITLRHAGSEEALADLKARALEALDRADLPFSKALAGSSQLNSFWLLSTLANHASAVRAFAASQKSRGTK